MKSKFIILTVIGAFLALAGVASATVYVNVTDEPIQYQATCDKAGAFSLTFGPNEQLLHGDQIIIDLDYGATLCRNIDMVISNGAGADLTTSGAGIGWVGANVNSNAPVYFAGPGLAAPFNGGVYFHIYGTAGTQRVYFDVIGDVDATSSLTIGPNPDDKMIVKFFDQKTNTTFGVDGIWIDDPLVAGANYTVDALQANNTICINVSALTLSSYRGYLDSAEDKFAFEPSSPTIAHAGPPLAYSLVPCKGAAVGNIQLGTVGGVQGTDTCDAFDWEDGISYCLTPNHQGNKFIIESETQVFDATAPYQVRMEILVNGNSGANGVYWTNVPVAAEGYTDDTAACNALGPIGAIAGTYTYVNAAGAAANPAAPNSNACDVASTARAVVLTSPQSNLNLDVNDDFLWIDIPSFNYDLDEVAVGDQVSVQITLTKAPCTTLWEGEIDIGTFGCPPGAVANMLLYPYFTPMDADADEFWDGIAIVNLGSADGQATLAIFEMDGDTGTMTVDVGGLSMYVDLLSNMLSGMTATGTLGDSRCYIIVTTDFNADGFAMLGRQDTGESLGYLPRK